jgi:hypothetical protein
VRKTSNRGVWDWADLGADSLDDEMRWRGLLRWLWLRHRLRLWLCSSSRLWYTAALLVLLFMGVAVKHDRGCICWLWGLAGTLSSLTQLGDCLLRLGLQQACITRWCTPHGMWSFGR